MLPPVLRPDERSRVSPLTSFAQRYPASTVTLVILCGITTLFVFPWASSEDRALLLALCAAGLLLRTRPLLLASFFLFLVAPFVFSPTQDTRAEHLIRGASYAFVLTVGREFLRALVFETALGVFARRLGASVARRVRILKGMLRAGGRRSVTAATAVLLRLIRGGQSMFRHARLWQAAGRVMAWEGRLKARRSLRQWQAFLEATRRWGIRARRSTSRVAFALGSVALWILYVVDQLGRGLAPIRHLLGQIVVWCGKAGKSLTSLGVSGSRSCARFLRHESVRLGRGGSRVAARGSALAVSGVRAGLWTVGAFLHAHLFPLWFCLLTVLVVFPWFLHDGYLFLLDFTWVPVVPFPADAARNGFLTSIPFAWIFWGLSRVLPVPLIQKLALSLPLFFAGLSMSRLIHWLLRAHPQRGWIEIAALIAGTFYALNPFVVSRALIGQFHLLLAYALTPWALRSFLVFWTAPSWAAGIRAGLWAVGVMTSNAHHLLLFPPLLVATTPFSRRGSVRRRAIVGVGTPLLLLLGAAVTMYWFVHRTVALPFDPRIPWAAPLAAPFSGNLFLDALNLTAMWDGGYLFLFPHEMLYWFGSVSAALLGTMFLGLLSCWFVPARRSLCVRLLLVGSAGVVLAIGVAHAWTAPLAAWLYVHVPFWLGMRESGKFLVFPALVEAVFLGYGASALPVAVSRIGGRRWGTIAVVVIAMLTLYLASAAFGGFRGQIIPEDYPESWAVWNARLAEDGDHPRMLFLPWHLALGFSFTGGRSVTNPADSYFRNAEVIAGDNLEVGGRRGSPFIYSESRRPISRVLERVLRDAPRGRSFGARLAPEHIRYVALAADTEDASAYDYLYAQKDLRLVFESPELVVWENQAALGF